MMKQRIMLLVGLTAVSLLILLTSCTQPAIPEPTTPATAVVPSPTPLPPATPTPEPTPVPEATEAIEFTPTPTPVTHRDLLKVSATELLLDDAYDLIGFLDSEALSPQDKEVVQTAAAALQASVGDVPVYGAGVPATEKYKWGLFALDDEDKTVYLSRGLAGITAVSPATAVYFNQFRIASLQRLADVLETAVTLTLDANAPDDLAGPYGDFVITAVSRRERREVTYW
jgi:hypothetical protein